MNLNSSVYLAIYQCNPLAHSIHVIISNQPGIKPRNSLKESSLLCKFDVWNTDIPTNREAVSNTAIQVDLVWLFRGCKNLLGTVSAFGGEDVVNFSGSNRNGFLDSGELLFGNETGVCEVAHVDSLSFGQLSDNVLGSLNHY